MDRTRYYSRRCFVCGTDNPHGLHAQISSDGNTVTTKLTPAQSFQGFDGVLHGGIIAALLDESLWYAVYVHGFVTVTVQLDVKLRRSAVPGESLQVNARFAGQAHRFLLAEGELTNTSGDVLAEAKGRFLPAPRLEAHLGELIITEKCE